MDASTRLIWFFDHFNPYFQAGYVVLCIVGVCFCVWSVTRHSSAGLILLGIGGVIAAIQTFLFCISAFQDGKAFWGFVPFAFRKEAYLYGRLLGPPAAIFSLITIVVLAIENARRKQRSNPALQPTAGRSDEYFSHDSNIKIGSNARSRQRRLSSFSLGVSEHGPLPDAISSFSFGPHSRSSL
jgi:hypothetical protein